MTRTFGPVQTQPRARASLDDNVANVRSRYKAVPGQQELPALALMSDIPVPSALAAMRCQLQDEYGLSLQHDHVPVMSRRTSLLDMAGSADINPP
jgi:hypothetical protein